MTGYGQFCPVAKAMEVLDERWTMLVLGELMAGSTRYNEIRRGGSAPDVAALLSARLRSLDRAGVTARVAMSLRTLVRIWRGERSWHDALRDEAVQVTAPPRVRREVAPWFGRSTLADLAAPRAGGA